MEDFNSMAKAFDTDKRVERAKAIADEIRSHIRNGNQKSAMEYGCGTGLVGFHLIDAFDTLLFLDSSSGMIEQVRQKLLDLEKSADNAICCDLATDTVQDLRADYIFSSLALHHIKDTKAILSRFYDILYPAGRLLIVDLDADDGIFHTKYPGFDGHNGFEQAALIGMAKEAGFDHVEAKSFYYGSKTVNGREAPYSFFILDAGKCSE